jgi:methionine-rich copper-binding protein CopC
MLVTLKNLQTQSIPSAQRLLTVVFVLFSINAFSTNYYANDNSTTGDVFTTAIGASGNDGLTASTPKASLTQIWNTYGPSGTNVITSGDIINIDAGNYQALDANLALSVDGISIVGAGSDLTFFDNNQTSSDANRWASITGNNITLTGFYLTGYNFGSGGANVVMISGVSNLIINNVMINENLPGGGSTAIVITGGSTVTFNGGGSSCNPGASSVAGGGVNVEGNGNTVTFNDFIFSANEKSFEGGSGLKVTGNATTTVDVNDCLFSDNVNESSVGGGAIHIADGATITIDGSVFNNNSASQASSINYGGAISIGRGSTATITSCTFDGNTATSSGNGGSIAVNTGLGSTGSTGTAIIDACTFMNGSGNDGADIMGRVSFSRPAILTVTNTTWSGTGEDIKNDNSATITVSNSNSPSFSGSVTFPNNDAPLASPTTNAPPETVCFSVLLPVELTSFTGHCRNQDNILQWETASEHNNDYFLVEKMNAYGEFEVVAKVDGVGNSDQASNYEWIDDDNSGTLNYYRLHQVDYDGRNTTFNTISVSQTCSTENVFYNEASNSITLFHESSPNEILSINVLNAAGQTLYSDDFNLSHITKQTVLQLNTTLSAGIYLISYHSSVNGSHIAKLSIR